jgi:predicted RNase H-like HicB family nuclease
MIAMPSGLIPGSLRGYTSLRKPQGDRSRGKTMEWIVTLHIEKLPEGVYLATSDEIQGLVAQGSTIQETIEIARDVARRLIEIQGEHTGLAPLPLAQESFDYPLIVNA